MAHYLNAIHFQYASIKCHKTNSVLLSNFASWRIYIHMCMVQRHIRTRIAIGIYHKNNIHRKRSADV